MTIQIGEQIAGVRGRAQTTSQQPLRYVPYTVTNVDTATIATVYSDPQLSSSIASPTTDANGVYSFYVPPGLYSIAFTTTESVDQPENFRVTGDDALSPDNIVDIIPDNTYELVTAPSYASGAALQAALNAASAVGHSTVRVGATNIGSTVVTVPTNVDLHCVGQITTTGDGGLVFDGHFYRNHRIWVERATAEWDDGTDTTSIAVKVRNCLWNTFDILSVRHCAVGLYLLGDGAGTVNNKFNLHVVIDNKVNIQPVIANSGWVNQNTFVGGQVRHSGSGFVGSTRTISNVAVTTNVATITTSTAHNLTLTSAATPNLPYNRSITITGLTNSVLNGTWVISTVPSTTTITFAIVTGDIASTADSGTMSNLPRPGTRGVAATSGGNGFNGNTFVGVNFEGGLPERTIDLNGGYNSFVSCRWEGATGIWLAATGVATQLLGGYELRTLPVIDSTSGSYDIFGEGVFLPAAGYSTLTTGTQRVAGRYRFDHAGAAGKEVRLFGSGGSIVSHGLQVGTLEAHASVRFGTANDCQIARQGAARLGTDADFELVTLGKTFKIKEGTNAKMGVVSLVGGTATVATTAITANSRIILTKRAGAGTRGILEVGTITAATSFVINSVDSTGALVADTSQILWVILEPA